MVIDADGLSVVTMHPELVQGYSRALLTPNAPEFWRLCDAFNVEHRNTPPHDDAQLVQVCEHTWTYFACLNTALPPVNTIETLTGSHKEARRSGGGGEGSTGYNLRIRFRAASYERKWLPAQMWRSGGCVVWHARDSYIVGGCSLNPCGEECS
jgi:hypothetical protein